MKKRKHGNVYSFFFGGKNARYGGRGKAKTLTQNSKGWEAMKLRRALKTGNYKTAKVRSFLGKTYSK